jgi:uncharacterized membrane protein
MKQTRAQIIIYTIASLVCLIGLADAAYLTVSYLTGENIVCSGSADCSQVLNSGYSKLGPVPLAALGAAAYFVAFSFATFAAFGCARAQKFFSLLVGAMFAMTLWLLFVQAFLLHAFCRYCLFSAAIIFLLAGLVIARPRPS